MRKMTIFQLGLFLFCARMMSLNAQVRIGANADPHVGAVLDLTNTMNRGLLLPQVSLDDFAAWTHDGGQALSGNSSQATGMTVYNKNKFALDGAGIYVWDGSKWNGIYAQGKAEGAVIPGPVICSENIPSVTFAPYNLGANITKLDSIATKDKISKTKAAIRCSYIDFDAVTGGYYQWGRITDGHQDRNSATIDISSLSSSDYNAATGQIADETKKKYFITNSSSPNDWQTTQNHNLWGNGAKIDVVTNPAGVPYNGDYYQSTEWQIPANTPCPAGFRVPTQDEWERIIQYDCNPSSADGSKAMGGSYSYEMPVDLIWVRVKSGKASKDTWSSGNHTGWAIYKKSDWSTADASYQNGATPLYDSGAPEPLLFLPAAGNRDYSTGNLTSTGRYGRYWSSSSGGTSLVSNDDSKSRYLYFGYNTVDTRSSYNRATGCSVRCVAE